MLEWAEIALKIRPDEESAKEKAALARQLIAEQKAANKQFSIVIQRAKTAFSEERWSDAISQCEIALELRPDSEEAHRLKVEARRRMEVKEKVQELLNRADVFFAQKLYSEALREVSKILSLDPTNIEAKDIERKISDVNTRHQEKIKNLVSKLDEAEGTNDFASAINICDTLIEDDSVNIHKWASKKERLISKRKEIEENKRKFDELKSSIQAARLAGKWQDVLSYTRTLDEIQFDAEIRKWISEAREAIKKFEVEKIQNEFHEAAANEEWRKIISLFDKYSFLRLKSSNATWYTKAKKCSKSELKNRANEDASDLDKGVEKQLQELNKVQKRKVRKKISNTKRNKINGKPKR